MNTNRRDFVKLLGGGIVVIITAKPMDLFAQRRGYPEDPNAYLRIDENGKITLFSGKIEMGQGVHTSLVQMAAEELQVPLESINIVMGDTDLVPWDAGTWGSQSTRMFGPAVRAAAAEARDVMLNLASQQLGVPREKLTLDNGTITDGKRKVTYGELAKGKQIGRLVGEKAVLRSAKDFKISGKPTKRLDRFDKVSGKAKYAGDIKHPGMQYARIVRPPMHGAKLKSIDTSKAKAMSGVTVVENGDLVAVLAADPELARAGLQAIKTEWDRPEAAFDTESVYDYFAKNVSAPDADGQFKSVFHTAYLAHAPMETHTASAVWNDGRLTAWVGTQSPFGARAAIAKALNLDETKVRVITPFVGGGFGGKSPAPQAVEAARLAVLTGKPVMVMFTRPEEFFYDTFGPASVINVVSSIDANGKITQWNYTTRGSGGRSSEVMYDVAGAQINPQRVSLHAFATGPWRAPGAGQNVFARESHIDIMAAAAKIDPLE
ncbi:MAG TPA: molybdopterin cofactor-binding domain-containing protein, partial [Thermoanaerobaculia bacterium]|nr:molybdopterin cofactor-binding domain-containing protein [Thermoanaerobaculia bacterium]